MLRDLQETDVHAICEINQEALGYSFSPEDTASQLAKLSQVPIISYLVMRMQLVVSFLGYHAEVMNPLFQSRI